MREKFLAKIDSEKNMHRFYRLLLPPGSCAILKQWGRIGEYIVEDWVLIPDHETAVLLFEKLLKKKLQRGYLSADSSVMPKQWRRYVSSKGVGEAPRQLSSFV